MSTKEGEKLLYEDLTYKIRGACFNVWKEFRGLFKEKELIRVNPRVNPRLCAYTKRGFTQRHFH